MRVFHFLPTKYALDDIAKRRLKVSRLAELNDPFELQAVNIGGRKKFRAALREWKADLHDIKGLLCFSQHWLDPLLWSHYAERHHGICLGFDITDKLVKSVQYSPQRVMAHVTDDGQFNVAESVVEILLYTKYESWKYEEEVRAFVDLDQMNKEGDLYFYPFSTQLVLREVILGPLCPESIQDLRSSVAAAYPSVNVIKSRLAFKWFQVVEK